MEKDKYGVVKSPLRKSAIFPSFFSQFPLFDDDFLSTDIETVTSSNISLSEDDSHYYVEANLPGLADEDIDLTFDKGVLWIKGQKKESEEDKKRKFYYRSSSSYSYRIAIPGDLDESVEPDAKFENGVIHVIFNKAKKEEPKKISIKRR